MAVRKMAKKVGGRLSRRMAVSRCCDTAAVECFLDAARRYKAISRSLSFLSTAFSNNSVIMDSSLTVYL